MMPISILLSMLLQFVLNLIIIIILSLLSFLLSFLSLLIMWEEFFKYNEFIDFLFHKKPSQNVIGRFKSESERKKIIIISSYIDSALEFKFYKFLG
jgi:ferredoxin